MTEKVLKLFFSLPVLLVVTYFIPALGIVLMISKYIVEKGYINNDKYTKTMLSILSLGFIIYIPRIAEEIVTHVTAENVTFPVLSAVLSSDIYKELLPYGKKLIVISIVFIICGYIVYKLCSKITSKVSSAVNKYVETEKEIAKENDLKMREKQERAKNFHVVKCPHCGATNRLTEKTGKCKSCRSYIE